MRTSIQGSLGGHLQVYDARSEGTARAVRRAARRVAPRAHRGLRQGEGGPREGPEREAGRADGDRPGDGRRSATRSTSPSSGSATTCDASRRARTDRSCAGATRRTRRTSAAWSSSCARRSRRRGQIVDEGGREARSGSSEWEALQRAATRRLLGGLRPGPLRQPRAPREPGRAARDGQRVHVPALRGDRRGRVLPGVPARRGGEGRADPHRPARRARREAVRRGVAEAQERAAPRSDQGRARPARQADREGRGAAALGDARTAPGSARSSCSSTRRAPTRSRGSFGPALGAPEGEPLEPLLVRLFATTDESFDRSYALFYDVVAPSLRLYRIDVGDTITIKAPSKSGYFSSVNVKVYGFLQFKGIERSGIAGMMSVLDIVSFRDLYGYLTAEKAAEIERLQRSIGARAVERDRAEAELFGGGGGARRRGARRRDRRGCARAGGRGGPGERGGSRGARLLAGGDRARRGAQRGAHPRRSRASSAAPQRDVRAAIRDAGLGLEGGGLAAGGGARRAVRDAAPRRPRTRGRHLLRHRARHHQQRHGDGDASAGEGDRDDARHRHAAPVRA